LIIAEAKFEAAKAGYADALARATAAVAQPAGPAGGAGKAKGSGRMTPEQANEKAARLARQMGSKFFLIRKSAQAEMIGCDLRTWKKTKLFQEAEKRKGNVTGAKAPRPPSASALPGDIADEKMNEVLNRLTEEQRKWDDLSEEEQAQLRDEQQAGEDPSPFDPDDRKQNRIRKRA
jgi:hypothetical protein